MLGINNLSTLGVGDNIRLVLKLLLNATNVGLTVSKVCGVG
ncbi:hypothetical protein LMG28138_03902 [Pararobbsia alpina]|uniref:Uncharacterized protein n=1 Tax=Pararobbsia alpina TaxID=621374 RepID=A0A6S7D493_9BURK|nr:hypothetical protein LMG28138_03902 [Pararobbsia alpina]